MQSEQQQHRGDGTQLAMHPKPLSLCPSLSHSLTLFLSLYLSLSLTLLLSLTLSYSLLLSHSLTLSLSHSLTLTLLLLLLSYFSYFSYSLSLSFSLSLSITAPSVRASVRCHPTLCKVRAPYSSREAPTHPVTWRRPPDAVPRHRTPHAGLPQDPHRQVPSKVTRVRTWCGCPLGKTVQRTVSNCVHRPAFKKKNAPSSLGPGHHPNKHPLTQHQRGLTEFPPCSRGVRVDLAELRPLIPLSMPPKGHFLIRCHLTRRAASLTRWPKHNLPAARDSPADLSISRPSC